jgi:hypothetical protein
MSNVYFDVGRVCHLQPLQLWALSQQLQAAVQQQQQQQVGGVSSVRLLV